MKTVQDLKLSKSAEKKVLDWLGDWLGLLVAQADGKEGNVYRADFANDDFFYFTDCRDILNVDPEGLSQETNLRIMRRKSKVMLQLLVKTLMGNKVGRKITCTHCGYEDRAIRPMYNGHYTYCPHCHNLTLCGYLETVDESLRGVMKELVRGPAKVQKK